MAVTESLMSSKIRDGSFPLKSYTVFVKEQLDTKQCLSQGDSVANEGNRRDGIWQTYNANKPKIKVM